MTTRTMSDQQVAALPIHGGRAELLEEIMSTPVDQIDTIERGPDDHAPARGRRALATVAAVAAVVATVGGLAAWRIPHQDVRPGRAPLGDDPHGAPYVVHHDHPSKQRTQVVRSVPGGAYFALGAAGWSFTHVDESSTGMELSYARDGQELELDLYPADSYQMYVRDRQEFGSGTRISLLGRDATLWASGPDSHDLIRTSEGDRFLEVVGSGMDEGAYLGLVDQIVQTDARGFAESLPSDVVTPYNRMEAIRHLLRGVETPPGFTADDVTLTGFNDAYHSAAGVAGSVGCAWFDVWAGGTDTDRQAAIEAFDGSRSWPLLQSIAHQGGYSSYFWSLGHRLAVGHTDKGQPLTLDGLRMGLGCT